MSGAAPGQPDDCPVQDDQILAYRARQKRRSLVTALILGGLVVLFFLASIARLGENVGVDRFSGN